MAQQTFSGVPGDFTAGQVLTAADMDKLREFLLYLIKDGDEGDTGEVSPLILDLGNDRVGINDATPSVTLDVTGNMRTSTGLLFGADTAAANQLDDYEEGTWTAGLEFGGTGVTTTQTAARYTKIGRAVSLTFTGVSPASIGSGNMRVTGLPFTPQATNWPGYGTVQMSPAAMQVGESAIQLYCVGATTKLDILVQSPTAHAFITDGDVGTGTNMYGSITYFV